jgi:hypothetical protein
MTEESQQSSSTERSRLHRDRKRRGITTFSVELPQNAVAALVAFGWLDDEERGDIESIKTAYAAFVGAAFRQRITRGN